jgi:hypothetical protein
VALKRIAPVPLAVMLEPIVVVPPNTETDPEELIAVESVTFALF